MQTAIIVIFCIFTAWLIIYRLFSKKIDAACERIKSPGMRNTLKGFLAVTYVISIIAVVIIYIFKIVSMFSKKDSSA